jgi:Fur family ferric uptake transcriptional regulator
VSQGEPRLRAKPTSQDQEAETDSQGHKLREGGDRLRPKTASRKTKQRQVILEELRKVKSHPTADEVYEMVKKKLPRISLGTVYRNLELLSDAGEIQTLELAGTQKRFDGEPATHYHVRCLNCGKVEDLDFSLDELEGMEEKVRRETGYEVFGYRLKFLGLCPKCQKEQAKAREKAPVRAD